MAFNEVADEGRLAIAVSARQVELATTVHGAIAVVIGFALEQPLIRHFSLLRRSDVLVDGRRMRARAFRKRSP
jgi:hypothetical protein